MTPVDRGRVGVAARVGPDLLPEVFNFRQGCAYQARRLPGATVVGGGTSTEMGLDQEAGVVRDRAGAGSGEISLQGAFVVGGDFADEVRRLRLACHPLARV